MEIEDIKALGFDPSIFTPQQRQLILQPSWGPENFMCDGEITYKEAKSHWQRKLRSEGLTEGQVILITKKVLG